MFASGHQSKLTSRKKQKNTCPSNKRHDTTNNFLARKILLAWRKKRPNKLDNLLLPR